MFVIRRAITAAALTTLLSAPSLAAQTPAAPEPARVLIVGTYHFANPGLDLVKTEVADVLSAARQAEIGAVVEALARFRPTRIAVEQLPAEATKLDSLYQAYRAGEHALSRNESEQLGFRLARMLDHARVFPIDHRGEFPIGPVMEYAQAHDPAFVSLMQGELARMSAESSRQQREDTIGEILRASNELAKLARDQGNYLRLGSVGAGDTNAGAVLLSKWYERNIHIFANIQRLAEPGERILVIIGSGHLPILRELATYDPEMVLVNPLEYLPEE